MALLELRSVISPRWPRHLLAAVVWKDGGTRPHSLHDRAWNRSSPLAGERRKQTVLATQRSTAHSTLLIFSALVLLVVTVMIFPSFEMERFAFATTRPAFFRVASAIQSSTRLTAMASKISIS